MLYSPGPDGELAEVWIGDARMLSSAGSSEGSPVEVSRGEAVESQTTAAGGLRGPEDGRDYTLVRNPQH